MTKEKLKILMKRYSIFDCELYDVIEFVSDLLALRAEELNRNEPYATRTIEGLVQASGDVYDLIEYVDVIEEDDE